MTMFPAETPATEVIFEKFENVPPLPPAISVIGPPKDETGSLRVRPKPAVAVPVVATVNPPPTVATPDNGGLAFWPGMPMAETVGIPVVASKATPTVGSGKVPTVRAAASFR
jgi:hypothetical protein